MSKFLTINSASQSEIELSASNGDAYLNTDDNQLWVWNGISDPPGWSKFNPYKEVAGSFTGNSYSISFDGVDDRATCTETDLPAGARSWSFWFKMSSTTSQIYGIWGSDTYNQYLGVNPGNGYFYCNDGSSLFYFHSGVTINTTDWYHVVITDNGAGAINCYFNGALKTVSGNQNQGAWRLKYFGRYNGPQPAIYFPGYLDEIAYFNSALTSSQVTNIYKGEDSGGSGGTDKTAGDLKTFNPQHWWRMGDFELGAGSIVKDQGGAASTLDLSLVGPTVVPNDAP